MSTISESSSFFQFNPQTNLWSVFFHDPANLPIEKIKKSFNQFGTIDSIDRFDGIDGKPLCFINFTTEDAVKRCILQMRSNRCPIHLKRFSFASFNSEEASKSPRRNSRDRVHNNNNNNNNNNKRRINGSVARGKYEKRGSFNSLNSIRASEDEDKSKGDEEFTEKSGNDNTSTTEFDISIGEFDISTAESEIPSDLTPKMEKEEIFGENFQNSTESFKILENSSAKWDISTKKSEIRSNFTSQNNKKEEILEENLQNSTESLKKLENSSAKFDISITKSKIRSDLPPKTQKDEILGENLQNSTESLKISENSSAKFDILTKNSQIRSNLTPKNNKKEEILQENLQNSSESLKILEQTSSSGSTNSLRSLKPPGLPDLIVRTPKMSPVSSPELYQSPKETIIQHVTAQDVIIANIHEACGINLLQTLLAKYEPLFISRIKVIPRIYIRYCHVYFPDEKTAKIVEKAYDKCEINGSELIVIRAETLARQMDSD